MLVLVMVVTVVTVFIPITIVRAGSCFEPSTRLPPWIVQSRLKIAAAVYPRQLDEKDETA
jgi:hypothetical protein